MAEKARELAERHGWFLARQFENAANAEVHARTTAREILAAFDGRQPRRLRHRRRHRRHAERRRARAEGRAAGDARSIVAEPDNAPILASGIAQAVRADGSPAASHPMFRPHLMQGWTPDFISEADAARDRRRPHRPDRRRERRAGARGRPRPRPARGHLLRPLGRRHLRRGAHRRRDDAGRQRHPLHGARHRRALPLDAALRRHPRGDDRGRARDRRARPTATGSAARRSPRPGGRGPRADRRGARLAFEAAIGDPGPAGGAVRAGMVRILLGAAQLLPRASASPTARSISTRSSCSSGDLGGDLRAALLAPHRRADDPAGLRRRRRMSAAAPRPSTPIRTAASIACSNGTASPRQRETASTPPACCRNGCTRDDPSRASRVRSALHRQGPDGAGSGTRTVQSSHRSASQFLKPVKGISRYGVATCCNPYPSIAYLWWLLWWGEEFDS